MKLLWQLLALAALSMAQDVKPTLDTSTTTAMPPKNATYWITMSRKVRPGHPFSLNAQILKGTDPVSVTFTIMDYQGEEVLLTSDPMSVSPGAVQTLTLDIPMDIKKPSTERWGPSQYKAVVEGRGQTVNFKEETYLSYEEKSFSIFIQTDKAMYKPGQEVKFRVLAMQPDMKVIRNESTDVIIEDPKGNRIRQYLDVRDPNGRGVLELTFRLADGIPTGEWIIKVTILGIEESKTFTVEDYVLPRFKVEVEAPPYGVTYDPILPVKIKATYTFGKPVTDATVVVSLGLHQPWNPSPSALGRKGMLNEKGEFSFEVSTKQLLEAAQQQNEYIRSLEWYTFEVKANVTDRHSGQTLSGESTLTYYQSPMNMQFLEISPNTFKPGLSTTVYLEATKRDKTLFSPSEASAIKINLNVTYEVLLSEEEREALRREQEKANNETASSSGSGGTDIREPIGRPIEIMPAPGYIYVPTTRTMVLTLAEPMRTLPETGWITLTFDVPLEATSVNIQAQGMKPFESERAYHYMSKSESPSDSYIQLQVPTEKPKVNSVVNIRAVSTEPVKELQYLVYSKGMLVLSDTVSSPAAGGSTSLDFSFTVTQAMSPNMNILAFYVREANYEFVVDSVSLSVDGTFQKPVTIEFNAEKVKPGETVEVIVKAEEDSLVYILGVDEKVKNLKSGNDITQETVQEELVEYDYGSFYPMYRYMFICGWPSYSSGVDAASVFESANVVVLTDGTVFRKKYDYTTMMTATGAVDDRVILQSSGPLSSSGNEAQNSGGFTEVETVRRDFSETWLFDISYILEGYNQVVLTATAPDSITSWIASVFSVHPTYGLSVAAQPAKLTTFRDMFVSLELPSSIVRGEDYCFTASVFSYYPGELPILLTLDRSDNFSNIHAIRQGESVVVSRENLYYSHFLGFMEENDIVSTQFCFTPNVIGDIPVKVSALTNIQGLSDAVERILTVKPEGTPRATSMPYLIDLSSGSWSEQVNIAYPQTTVQGSQKLTVNIAGNLLGPMFENLDDLLKQPYGCGEQNMLNFAPNTFLLRFFYVTNQMTDEILDRSRDYMLSGYQKELKYEHPGGGFSAFGAREGSSENASLWLTTFVELCFAEAQAVRNEYGDDLVAIDTNIISRNAEWMTTNQNRNGSFTEHGKVFHKEMQGGSAEGEALTAYVVISLHQAIQVLQDYPDVVAKVQQSIDRGVEYLAQRVSSLRDPYDICLTAFALNLVNHADKDVIFNKMESIAVTGDGMKYWERSDSLHKQLTPYSWSASVDSMSIEMTAYALRTYNLRGIAKTNGLSILRWLSNQRGPNGGFISTQDTIIGLQALTTVAAELYSNEDIPMTVTVSYNDASGQAQTSSLKLSKTNEMLLQSVQIPFVNNAPTSVSLSAVTDNGQSGPSTAIAEVILRYNVVEEVQARVYDMSYVLTTSESGFELAITVKTVSLESSSMSLLKVDIPAGHSPDTEKLTQNKYISMVEILDDNLVLYFDTGVITKRGITVVVTMSQTGGTLAKAQPKSITISDYYNPDYEQTTTYTLRQESFCNKARTVGVCQYT